MSLSYVTVTFTEQDAADDAGAGSVVIAPTSVVTAAGVTVVSQTPVSRVMSGGTVSVELVASDNTGTVPAAGFWAYLITLPGWTAPQLYLIDYENGATQRFDQLTPVVAQTTYGPAASTGAWAGGTATEYVAPAVVALTDGATISVNAAAGNDFRVTLGGNRTIANPASPADGQHLLFQLTQDSTGSRTVTWGGEYDFGSGSAPTLSTAAGDTDVVAFVWNAARSKAICLGSATGF